MIDRKQLMIGNYVMLGDRIHVVDEIRTGNIVGRWINTNDGKYSDYKVSMIEEFYPIPLTEEILLKCGFEKRGYKKGHIGVDFKSGDMTMDFVLEEPLFMGEWDKHYTFELPYHRFVNVEYLHSLQNLFFMVTREELEIKF